MAAVRAFCHSLADCLTSAADQWPGLCQDLVVEYQMIVVCVSVCMCETPREKAGKQFHN